MKGYVSISTCNWHNYALLQQLKESRDKKFIMHDVISGIRGIKGVTSPFKLGFLFAVTVISVRTTSRRLRNGR